MRRFACVFFVVLILSVGVQLFEHVRAEPVVLTVPDDFSTIQGAINNAVDGDTIFVKAGTYYEHVVVDKTLSLIGDGSNTTIIDGNLTGNVVRITQDHVNIRGFKIQRSGGAYTNSGIYVGSTRYCDISANYIVDNEYGVHGSPRNMSVTDNTIEGNFLGVDLQSGSTGNVISGNHLVANYVGVHLNLADANYILQNNMTNNWRSVTLWESKNNTLYHNNFLNSTEKILVSPYANFFDNGFEGNYWSEYNGTDLNLDGIGDVPYIIDVNNADNYPLMDPWSASTRWTVDNDGPADFDAIQEAINAANDGDTIFVKAGTYYEHVVVNKAVLLVGEDRDTTVIDGNETGPVVIVAENEANLTRFTIRAGQNSHPICDVWLENVSQCNINENTLADSFYGVYLNESDGNRICANYATNLSIGICGFESDGNLLLGNEFGANSFAGINFHICSFNNLTQNLIKDNSVGIRLLDGANNNNIYHNNFDNTIQVYIQSSYNNTWDNSYPSGGNYWSNYAGSDARSGPYQNETGGDGIGDTPLILAKNDLDRYPLMEPWIEEPCLVGDVNSDGKVDMKDVGYVSRRFMCVPSDRLWDVNADFNSDGKINMVDIGTVARHFGESLP